MDKTVRSNILSEEFWEKLDLVIKILKPMVIVLKLFESDTSTLSTVFSYFNKLIQQIGEISWNFIDNIQKLIKKSWEYSYHPIMMVAYMLDPRFLEESRNGNIEATGYNEFTAFTNKCFNQKKSAKLFIELVKFHQKVSPYDNETIWISSSGLSLSIWWERWPKSELQQLAVKILLIPTSSAAAERNFSTFGFIHNKIRNRLSNVKKLVYNYRNLQIYDKPKKMKINCKRSKRSKKSARIDVEESNEYNNNNNIGEKSNSGVEKENEYSYNENFNDYIFGFESNVRDLTN